MRPHDDADAPEPHDHSDVSTPVAPDADPVAFLDEDTLEADLGDVDAPLPHDELDDIDEQLLDADEDDEDDDDDFEMALLHDLGIDLDAPDADEPDLDLGVSLVDDSNDEEVAA